MLHGPLQQPCIRSPQAGLTAVNPGPVQDSLPPLFGVSSVSTQGELRRLTERQTTPRGQRDDKHVSQCTQHRVLIVAPPPKIFGINLWSGKECRPKQFESHVTTIAWGGGAIHALSPPSSKQSSKIRCEKTSGVFAATVQFGTT